MKDKYFIYSTLMTIRQLENQNHIEESMKEIHNFCCDYYHIKKGYKDEHGTWIDNPDYILLRIWITEKTGWEYNYKDKLWQRTYLYKAKKKFDEEEEVQL